MHAELFIQDMAIIMIIAGLVTVLFNKLKQPVVLGYLVAGIIIGPYLWPTDLLNDTNIINVLAELGVVFLMFSLGLEFSLKKLAKVGLGAFIIASLKIGAMIYIGYLLGISFGWKINDAIFLGAILSISSTTIIVKALSELGMKQEKFAQLIYGILIIEDILAIALIALLSGIAVTGKIDASSVFTIIGKLSLFIIVALVVGLLTVPKFISYVNNFRSSEMLLIAVLGLCFGFCFIVIKLDYSVALGSFIIGAIIAEAQALHKIERLIEPLRDMFCAVFFVTIGMLFDPSILIRYTSEVIIITVVMIFSKIVFTSLGGLVAGQNGRTSMQVGMGLIPIGEFSFIIASLGLTHKVTSEFLYPIVVAISSITIFITPYFIKSAESISCKISVYMPRSLANIANLYLNLLHKFSLKGNRADIARLVFKIILQIIANCALVTAIFFASAYLAISIQNGVFKFYPIIHNEQIRHIIIFTFAMLMSLPFLIAAYRKIKALSMIFSEIVITGKLIKRFRHHFDHKKLNIIRVVVYEFLSALGITIIVFAILSSSRVILPTIFALCIILFTMLILAIVFRRPLIWVQSYLQISLFNVMQENKRK